MLSQQSKRNMHSSKLRFVISRPRALRPPPLWCDRLAQSDNEGEEGEVCDEEGVPDVPDVPMEQDSGGSGAVKKGSVLGRRMLLLKWWRGRLLQFSTEEALRFQA